MRIISIGILFVTQLWKVYRENEILGPMTATELRQALREGIVEPFDLVGKEGSKLRLELIEADEVFDVNENEPPAAQIQTFKAEPKGRKQNVFGREKTKFNEFYEKIKSRVTGNPQQIGPQLSYSQTQPSYASPHSNQPRKNLQKIYYAVDPRGKSLGPLAGSEVIGLFQRGILGRDVRIHRGDATRKIPIGRFVALYAGQLLQDLAMVPGKRIPRSHPNSKVINEMARGVAIRQQATQDVYTHPIVLIAIGLIVGVVLFLLAESGIFKKRRLHPNRQTSAVSHEEEVRLDPVRQEPRKQPQPLPIVKPKLNKSAVKQQEPLKAAKSKPKPLIDAEPPEEVIDNSGEARPTKTKAKAPKAVTKTRPAATPSSKAPPPRPTAKPMTTRIAKQQGPETEIEEPPLPEPESVPAPRSKSKPAAKKAPQPAVAADDPLPSAKAKTPKPKAAGVGGGGGGLGDLAGKIGQSVTLGPLSFSKSAVGSCKLKCKVPFSDGKGGTITGIFFKDSPYGDMLRGAGGKVTITGTIRQDGSGFSILISGVN